MLRNALLAGAAALALLPGIGWAQTSPSETAGVATPGGSTTPYSSTVPGGDDNAAAPSDADSQQPPSARAAGDTSGANPPPTPSAPSANPAPGYYSSDTSQPAPDTSGQTPPNPGASGMDMSRSGSAYTQPPAAAQPPSATQPQASAPQAAPAPAGANQPVVVVSRVSTATRLYVRDAAMGDNYEIQASRIAMRRAQSDTVRQYANDIAQQHSQSSAILTQAANQAGVPVNSSLDAAHRDMLRRLRRAPAADFDRVYMNQQLTAHMNAASLHQGYAKSGDNPTMQQAAQQISPIVQQHLDVAWADSGVPQRMAEQRNNELSKLAQASPRGATYRGYTVVGPTSAKQLREESPTVGGTGYTDQYTGGGGTAPTGAGQPGAATPGTAGTPQYQGYTSTQPAPGAATPGAPGTVTNPNVTNPNTNPGVGAPQYQGYTSPGAPAQPGAQPGATTNPNVTGTTPGTAQPGASPSTTTPGATSPGAPSAAAPTTGTSPYGAYPPSGSASQSAATPPAGSAGPR